MVGNSSQNPQTGPSVDVEPCERMNRACIGNPQNGSMAGYTVAYIATEHRVIR